MREVLIYKLRPVPWLLATPDGGLVRMEKASLLPLLESGVQPVEDIPPTATLISDGMAVFQTTHPTGTTLEHIAEEVFRFATQGLICRGHVDFVVDQYLPLSVKNLERVRRAASGML